MEQMESLQRVNRQQRLAEWSRRVEACRNSGLTVVQWFQEHGIAVVSNALHLRFFKPRHGSAVAVGMAESAPPVTIPTAVAAPVQETPVNRSIENQMNGGITVKKELSVEGMMCQNCVKHVTHALEGIPGAADIQVSLEDKKATVHVPETVTDDVLKEAVSEAGYEVTGIITYES